MPLLKPERGATIAGDAWAFQTPLLRVPVRLGRRTLLLIGFVAFAICLLLTLPASALLGAAGAPVSMRNAVGTIWSGEAAIGTRAAVSWRFAPLRSILSLGIASDISIRGDGTDINGRALWRPGRLLLERVSGMAGPGLVDPMIKDLPFTCDVAFSVDLDRVVLAGRRSGVTGAVRSGPGACAAKNGLDATPAPLPALIGRAVINDNGSEAWFAAASDPNKRLAQMTIDETGRLTAAVLDAGALILPPVAGQVTIETQL